MMVSMPSYPTTMAAWKQRLLMAQTSLRHLLWTRRHLCTEETSLTMLQRPSLASSDIALFIQAVAQEHCLLDHLSSHSIVCFSMHVVTRL